VRWSLNADGSGGPAYCEVCRLSKIRSHGTAADLKCPECPRPRLTGNAAEAAYHLSNLSTQWRVSDGCPTGLDYQAMLAYCELSGYRFSHDVFLLIKEGEAEALLVWSERRKNKSATRGSQTQ
jgi:hypothetical protein